MGRVDPGKTVYVYGLHTEADKTIMYVGCSVNPQRRLRQHLGLAMQGYAPKALGAWLRACVEWGQDIVVAVLESCEASEAPLVENQWIEKTRSANPELLNIRRYSPYTPHIDKRQRLAVCGMRLATAIVPGSNVIHMRNAYANGRTYQDPTSAKVIRLGESFILVGETVDGQYQERWIPPHRLYELDNGA